MSDHAIRQREILELATSLLPKSIPDFTPNEIAYMAGVDESEIQRLAFPDSGFTSVELHQAHDYTVLAKTKWTGHTMYALTRRGPGSKACAILEIPEVEQVPALNILKGSRSVHMWYEFCEKLPPSSLVGYYPSWDAGNGALRDLYCTSDAELKLLEAIHLQASLLRASADSVMGLLDAYIKAQPVKARIQLAYLTNRAERNSHDVAQRNSIASPLRGDALAGNIPAPKLRAVPNREEPHVERGFDDDLEPDFLSSGFDD